MLKDSLVPQQTYDEIFAKYQGAQAQYIAVQAELDRKQKKAPGSSNKQWLVAKGKSYWRIAGSRNQTRSAISLLPGHEYRNDYLGELAWDITL
jgi:hypothetical protein